MIGGIHPMMMTPVGGGGLKPQEVFAATTYNGDSSTNPRSITTGVDMTQGGLVWLKCRNNTFDHALFDSARTLGARLSTNSTAADIAPAASFTLQSFDLNGFSIGTENRINQDGNQYSGLSFRQAGRFFKVVRWTGDGSGARTLSHSLGLTPGLIIAKADSTTSAWAVRHRSATGNLYLNTTAAQTGSFTDITAMDATSFTVSSSWNASGVTYVAYLFAHDTDASGIVQCGSFTLDGNGNGAAVLPWGVQFVLGRISDTTDSWGLYDTARGLTSSGGQGLVANTSSAESANTVWRKIASGFSTTTNSSSLSGRTLIYATIREPIF